MRILFLHQNMPAQFRALARALARDGHDVDFLTQNVRAELPGVRSLVYRGPTQPPGGHKYLHLFETAVRTGQQVARKLGELKRQGEQPDVVIAHSGWGEPLFLKDICPDAKLIVYAEYFYRGTGADIGFDPEDGCSVDTICRARVKNAHLFIALEQADAAVSPTRWQRSAHPPEFQPKIRQIHEGLDLSALTRRAGATFTTPGGKRLTGDDPVVTFVARNLEPYRGIRTFLRAIPRILAENPDAHILIVGGSGTSYGRKPPAPHASWLEALASESELGSDRVHVTGRLPYDRYLDALSISRAHVYLTYPFVLSWSMLEAMAMGVPLVASDTAPVREVVQHGWNGLLVDFFDADQVARAVGHLLNGAGGCSLAKRARQTVEERYRVEASLIAWRRLIRSVCQERGRPGRTGRIPNMRPQKGITPLSTQL